MKYVCNEPFWKFKKLDGNESYCKVCKKNVVDFRNYSATELSEYKTQNPEVSCGVFTSEQAGIDVDTVYGVSVSKIVLASLISFFTFSVSESKAQSVKDSLKTEQYPVVKGDTIMVNDQKNTVNDHAPEQACKTKSIESKASKRTKTLFWIGSTRRVVTRFPFVRRGHRYVGKFMY